MTKPWRNITTIWSDKKNCVFVFISVNLTRDSTVAYQFLKMAERGYQRNLANGQTMYQKAFEAVEKMLADSQYDPVREEVDALLEESD